NAIVHQPIREYGALPRGPHRAGHLRSMTGKIQPDDLPPGWAISGRRWKTVYRRRPLRASLEFLVLMFWLLSSGILVAAQQNILLIIADDYGVDSSSLYNTNASASLPPTPNIVALAQSGVLFRNAYAYPVCSPTRACLITGRFGFRTGI